MSILKAVKELEQKSQLANILHELVISHHVLFLQVLLGMTFGQLDAGNEVFTISANGETSLDVPFIPPQLAEYKAATSHTERI